MNFIPDRTHKYGLLLLNMGGPAHSGEIYPYLYNLFSDPYIIGLPDFWRKKLAFVLASLRRKTAQKHYDLIGGGSPLGKETANLVRILESQIRFPVRFAMRYVNPRVKDVIAQMTSAGINHIVVLPLYPQYSAVTTGSSVEEFQSHVPPECRFRIIDHHYDHSDFIQSHAHQLEESLRNIQTGQPAHVLFVAHSIPLKRVESGDPYVRQVEATASMISRETGFKFPWSIAYQSRVGPVKWQGPSLEEALAGLRRDNIVQLVVHPVSFVLENLETRFDLDLEFRQKCMEAGVNRYIRVPVPGTHPSYIKMLVDLCIGSIQQWEDQYVAG